MTTLRVEFTQDEAEALVRNMKFLDLAFADIRRDDMEDGSPRSVAVGKLEHALEMAADPYERSAP